LTQSTPPLLPTTTHPSANNIHLNANCLEEVDRIHHILTTHPSYSTTYASSIGLRINPLVGSGTIAELSVSTSSSKFGVALNEENKRVIREKFKEYPWLTGLHIHVGSQVRRRSGSGGGGGKNYIIVAVFLVHHFSPYHHHHHHYYSFSCTYYSYSSSSSNYIMPGLFSPSLFFFFFFLLVLLFISTLIRGIALSMWLKGSKCW